MTNTFGNLRDRALKLLATSPPQEVDGLLQEMHVLHAELEVQQDELRESQRRASELAAYYRQLFFESPLAFVVLTDAGKVHEANQQATWLLGWSTGETALPFAQHVAAEDQSEWTRLVTRAADSPASSELRIRRVGGERRLCRVTLSARPGGGWLLGMQDLTALRDAEARQRIASERAARMLRDTRDGVLFVNADVRLIDEANQAIASLLGTTPEALRGRPLSTLFPADCVVRQDLQLKQAAQMRPPPAVMLTFSAADGSRVEVEATLGQLVEGPVRLLTLLLRDVSARARLAAEREALAARLMESQKLEAVGQLAAGVAHDMNNMLTVILSCASEPLPETPAETTEALAEVRTAALRGRELTGRLSALFRQKPLREARFDLGALVQELASLLRRTLPPSIRIEVKSPARAWWLLGDEGAWHQALLNLAINARDAMPEGGDLTLACLELPSGPELVVADTGAGMTPEVMARAFEPFFTTKPTGQGTGLGLAHVHAVARSHRMELRCESKPGEGTRFRIQLRLADDPSGTLPAAGGRRSELPRLKGRVLLVDDDALARRATSRLLKRGGAEVVEAAHGREALEVLQREPGIRAVLTDLSMPEMDGEVLAAQLREVSPALPVVVFTGEIRDARHQRLLELGVKQVVSKPFTTEELLGALAAHLPAA